MYTKVIDQTTVVVSNDDGQFLYKQELQLQQAMLLAKKVCEAHGKINMLYWIPITKNDVAHTIMMKLKDKKLEEYNPTQQTFDKKSVLRFVNRGKMKFHVRRAYWRRHKNKLIVISGCFVNFQLADLNNSDYHNITAALETYNATILKDIRGGVYGIGVKMMSFAEMMRSN